MVRELRREVQFLKEQLKTYDSEETVFFNGSSGVIDAQKQARIEGLEKLLDEYKSEIDRLNKQGPLLDSTYNNGKRKRLRLRLCMSPIARRHWAPKSLDSTSRRRSTTPLFAP